MSHPFLVVSDMRHLSGLDLAPSTIRVRSPNVRALDDAVPAAARDVGLHLSGPQSGRFLFLGEEVIERHTLFTLADANDNDAVVSAAVALVKEMARRHGPGRVWWASEFVCFVGSVSPSFPDAFQECLADGELTGPVFVALGSHYFHERLAQRIPARGLTRGLAT